MGCVDGEGKSWYGLCGECGGVRRMRGFWGGGGGVAMEEAGRGRGGGGAPPRRRGAPPGGGGGGGGKWNVWACKKGGGKD